MPGQVKLPEPPRVTLESALAARQGEPDTAAGTPGEHGAAQVRGLSAGLLLLLAIGLVPSLVGIVWYLNHSREAALRDAYAQADLVATSTTERLRWLMQDAEAMLSSIAARPQVQALDQADCDSIFTDFGIVSPTYKALSLRRADGSSICSELSRPPSRDVVTSSPWFRAAVERPGLYATDVHLGAVQNVWTVRLTYPVTAVGDDGESDIAALLVVPVDLDQLQRRLFSSVPADNVVAIVDGSNHVLARSVLHAERVGKPAPENVARMLDAVRQDRQAGDPRVSSSRQFAEVGVGGVRRLFVARTVPMTDWVVVSALPEAETLRGYVASRNRGLAAIAALLLLAGVAAWWVGRGILVPIRGLAATARAMAAGDATRRAVETGRDAGPHEIREVAREFNRMVAATQAYALRLKAGEAHYRTLVQNLPVAFVSHRADSAIEVFNQRACELLRMTPDQMEGRRALDRAWYFVDAEGRRVKPADYPVSRVLGTGLPMPAQTLGIVSEGADGDAAGPAFLQAEGEPHPARPPHTWVLVTGYPQFDDRGRLERAIIAFIDVTAQHQSEQLRVAKEAAEAASQAKSAFLSRVSHELRTPLNAINGFSELMLTDPRLQPDFRAKVGHVLTAGRHLLSLIEQVLDLSRLDAGSGQLELRPVPLWPLLQECLALGEPLARSRGVTLALQLPAGADGDGSHLWARGDATRLRQIVINLLSNAIKYNRPGGHVQVSVRTSTAAGAAPGVTVDVADDGAGLSPEQVAQLFQPFNRLGAEARGIEGHGLGLLISRTLAQGMGGDITVRSSVGQGACFSVHLPAAAAPASPARLPRPAQPGATPGAGAAAGSAARRALRVLYIEDNELNMLLMRHIVSMRPGIEFFEATDGMAGVQAAIELKPDLVLVDIGLPLLDGFGVVRQLRAHADTARVACWAVTADTTAETAAQARAAGFERCMTKPVALDSMLDALDEWMAQQREHDESSA